MLAAHGRCKSSITPRATSGVLVNWSLNITPQITVTPVNRSQWAHEHVSDRLPDSAVERHLYDPARPRYSRRFRPRAGYVGQRGPECASWATAKRPDDHRAVHTPTTTCPRQSRAESRRSGSCELDDRGARQLHRSGRYDFVRSERAAGPDQPHLSA